MPIFKPSARAPQIQSPFVAAPDQQTGIRQSGAAISAGLGAVANLAGTVKQVADNRDRTDMQYARSETSLATNRTNFALQNAQSPEEIADALSSFNKKMDAWGDGKNEVSGTRNLRSSGSRNEYKTKYLPQIKQQMALSGEMATVRVNRNDSIAKNNTVLADTIDNASTDSSVILGYEVINNTVDSLAENNALPRNETAASYKEKQKSKLEESRYQNNISQVINMDNLSVEAAEEWISTIKDGVEHSSNHLSRKQKDNLLSGANRAIAGVRTSAKIWQSQLIAKHKAAVEQEENGMVDGALDGKLTPKDILSSTILDPIEKDSMLSTLKRITNRDDDATTTPGLSKQFNLLITGQGTTNADRATARTELRKLYNNNKVSHADFKTLNSRLSKDITDDQKKAFRNSEEHMTQLYNAGDLQVRTLDPTRFGDIFVGLSVLGGDGIVPLSPEALAAKRRKRMAGEHLATFEIGEEVPFGFDLTVDYDKITEDEFDAVRNSAWAWLERNPKAGAEELEQYTRELLAPTERILAALNIENRLQLLRTREVTTKLAAETSRRYPFIGRPARSIYSAGGE